MSGINDIWKSADGRLPDEMIEAYLAGTLSDDEVREVELYLSEEGIESDAVEGLENVSFNEMQELKQKVNHKLQHELKRNRYRNNNFYQEHKWSFIAVLLIIVLCIIGYYVLGLTL